MKNFTKENWFKFGISVILLFTFLGLYLFIHQKYFSNLSISQINTISQTENNDINIKQENDSLPPASLSSPYSPTVVPEKKLSIPTPEQVIPKDPKTETIKQHRVKLLTALRAEPFFNQNTTYQAPRDECTTEASSSNNSDTSKWNLAPSSGIDIGIDNEMADIHAYDKKGGHTGLIPKVPGYDFDFPEENALGVQFMKFGSHSYLSINENIDGKIKIVGKKYGTAIFEIRGDGNTCGIVEITIPVTPYSVGTLPITSKGDIGPFSYDIDGDGKQDFILSLLHPLLPEKQIQLDAVIADMKAVP